MRTHIQQFVTLTRQLNDTCPKCSTNYHTPTPQPLEFLHSHSVKTGMATLNVFGFKKHRQCVLETVIPPMSPFLLAVVFYLFFRKIALLDRSIAYFVSDLCFPLICAQDFVTRYLATKIEPLTSLDSQLPESRHAQQPGVGCICKVTLLIWS